MCMGKACTGGWKASSESGALNNYHAIEIGILGRVTKTNCGCDNDNKHPIGTRIIIILPQLTARCFSSALEVSSATNIYCAVYFTKTQLLLSAQECLLAQLYLF